MKRQTEDVLIKYKATPYQGQNNEINIDIPDDLEFLPGDFIEMIVSEKPNFGGIAYYAKLICYKYIDDDPLSPSTNIELVDGILANGGDGEFPLQAKSGSFYLYGTKRYIGLYADSLDKVFYDEGSQYFVNLIIHRSNNIIECLYV